MVAQIGEVGDTNKLEADEREWFGLRDGLDWRRRCIDGEGKFTLVATSFHKCEGRRQMHGRNAAASNAMNNLNARMAASGWSSEWRGRRRRSTKKIGDGG